MQKKKKWKEKPQVIDNERDNRIDEQELYPIGYYTCSETGMVTHLVDPEKSKDIKIWVCSEKLSKFKFSGETLRYPIVIRKGNDIWYASFRNFRYVLKDVMKNTNRFRSVEMKKTLFDPEMFKYTIRINLHNTTGTEALKHPWMFFQDKMVRAMIEEPHENARKSLNVSYAYSIGKNLEPVFFHLMYMGGKYYCQSITDVDPMLSREQYIRGYKLSEYSTDKMTIRFKEYNDELIVVGGYYDPEKYNRQMYYLANREIKDKEERKRFYNEMRSFKLKTFTIREKYAELSVRNILMARKTLSDSYKRDILNKIQKFMGR